jgi:hypothetical protein
MFDSYYFVWCCQISTIFTSYNRELGCCQLDYICRYTLKKLLGAAHASSTGIYKFGRRGGDFSLEDCGVGVKSSPGLMN